MLTIFVDNDQDHIDDVKKKNGDTVHTVKISEEPLPNYPDEKQLRSYSREKMMALTDTYFADRVENHEKNLFLIILKNTKNIVSTHPINQGVSSLDFDHIESVIDQEEAKQVDVLFDFDRTLTQVEGLFLMSPSDVSKFIQHFKHPYYSGDRAVDFNEEKYVDDMAEFLFGGKDRMAMLKTRIEGLKRKNANIYILTANTACLDSDRRSGQLLEVIRKVIPDIQRNHVICSNDYGGSKGLAIKQRFYESMGRKTRSMKKRKSVRKSKRSVKKRKSVRKSKRSRKSVRKSKKKNRK